MKMICKRCGNSYKQPYKFCPLCTAELEKNVNQCSSFSVDECQKAIYPDNYIVCGYCGSLTTYEKERRSKTLLETGPMQSMEQ